MNKVMKSADAAILASGLQSGHKLCIGGFGLCGSPQTLLEAVRDTGAKDLTVVSNTGGVENYGIGILFQSKQVKRMVSSYVGENAEFSRQYLGGDIEVEFTPQGTLAEKLRAGGSGVPAFYTPAGVGTLVETGGIIIKYAKDGTALITSAAKEVKVFDGRKYILEDSIRVEVSLIKAWKADKSGNLVFRGTARNFNPDCAMAGKYTIAEVDEIVEVGSLNPDEIHVPGVYVQGIVLSTSEKRIERRTTNGPTSAVKISPTRERIVKRAALEFQNGMTVNLGIGIPTLASNYVPDDININLQCENGLVGIGPYPDEGNEDPDWINAGKETITALPSSSIVSSSDAFGMIRGDHVHVTMLGAMQVSMYGDIANWMIPGKKVKGMGGAMDLVSCNARVIVTMEHTAKGNPKILRECTFPLTGARCCDRIITELAVFDVNKSTGLELVELAEGVSLEQVQGATEAPFTVSENLRRF